MHSAINSVLYIGFLILLLISLTYEPVAAFDPHPPHQVFDFNKHALEPLIRDAEQRHQLHSPVPPSSPNHRLGPGGFRPTFKVPTLPRR